jgi:hypothetical protein
MLEKQAISEGFYGGVHQKRCGASKENDEPSKDIIVFETVVP